MRRLVLALAIATSLASPAFAESWRSLGADDDGARIAVDDDALRSEGDLRIVRTRWIFPASDARRAMLIAIERYDCARQQLSTRRMETTLRNGQVEVQAWDDDQWDEVLPNTTASNVRAYVCR